MSNEDRAPQDEESIARLIETAGRGPTASREARSRIYARVRSEWLGVVESERRRAEIERPVWSLAIWVPKGPRWAFAIAASGVAALIVTYTLLVPGSAPSPELAGVVKAFGSVQLARSDGQTAVRLSAANQRIAVGDSVLTGSDGAVAMLFDDGVVLRVGADSEVVIESATVLNMPAGTVYIDTAAAEGAGALSVRTSLGEVQHVGTQYEVHAAPERLRVRVREGAVKLRDDSREFIGEVGQQLLLTRQAGEPIRTVIATAGPDWQWVEALASAPAEDEQSLSVLLAWISRETGRQLEYGSERIEANAGETVLHGVAGLTPAEVLEVIQSTTEFQYSLEADTLTIR